MECVIDNKSYNLPDFLIVGAAKSGTSSLHFYLAEHENICMPFEKELNFWHTYRHEHERAILRYKPIMPKNIDEYTSFFKCKNYKELLGEVSPSYLIYYIDTVENIKYFYKNKTRELKIVIILREPIDKIWSHYKFVKNYGLDPENLSLKKSVKKEDNRKKDFTLLPDLFYIHNTRYFEQVKHYLDNFNNVKILLYDDLKSNTQLVLNEICDFLGIDRFVPETINDKFNPSKKIYIQTQLMKPVKAIRINKLVPKIVKKKFRSLIYREEKMPRSVLKKLKKEFKNEVLKLNEVIDKDLSTWLKKYD